MTAADTELDETMVPEPERLAAEESAEEAEVSERLDDAEFRAALEAMLLIVDAPAPAEQLAAALDDGANTFRIALIPHTLRHTVAAAYRVGALVNLEVDVLARYAERLLRLGTE